jgi:hypothetical protein
MKLKHPNRDFKYADWINFLWNTRAYQLSSIFSIKPGTLNNDLTIYAVV